MDNVNCPFKNVKDIGYLTVAIITLIKRHVKKVIAGKKPVEYVNLIRKKKSMKVQ